MLTSELTWEKKSDNKKSYCVVKQQASNKNKINDQHFHLQLLIPFNVEMLM